MVTVAVAATWDYCTIFNVYPSSESRQSLRQNKRLYKVLCSRSQQPEQSLAIDHPQERTMPTSLSHRLLPDSHADFRCLFLKIFSNQCKLVFLQLMGFFGQGSCCMAVVVSFYCSEGSSSRQKKQTNEPVKNKAFVPVAVSLMPMMAEAEAQSKGIDYRTWPLLYYHLRLLPPWLPPPNKQVSTRSHLEAKKPPPSFCLCVNLATV